MSWPGLEDLDARSVRPGLQVLADQAVVHRVERPGDLDAEVPVDLRLRPDRDVVGRRGERQQQVLLLGAESLIRTNRRRAVDAHPGAPETPANGATLSVLAVEELFSGKEAVAHKGHDSFDTRLVIRLGDARWVDGDASRLGVFEEGVVYARCQRICGGDDGATAFS